MDVRRPRMNFVPSHNATNAHTDDGNSLSLTIHYTGTWYGVWADIGWGEGLELYNFWNVAGPKIKLHCYCYWYLVWYRYLVLPFLSLETIKNRHAFCGPFQV
jgi:hypothetical protein